MTNNEGRSVIKELLEAEKTVKLTDKKKKFLLTDEGVMEAIIAGLIRDFKYV
ncbi:MAG: hypothetical protein JXR11_06280 [Balneola sp.]